MQYVRQVRDEPRCVEAARIASQKGARVPVVLRALAIWGIVTLPKLLLEGWSGYWPGETLVRLFHRKQDVAIKQSELKLLAQVLKGPISTA